MKILHYLPYSYHIHTGGLEKLAQTITEGLGKKKGNSYCIVASDVKRGHKEDRLEDYTDTIFLPSFDLIDNFPVPQFRKRSYRTLSQQIRQYNPDIVFTSGRFFLQSVVGGCFAKRHHKKRIHIEHGTDFLTGYPRYVRIFSWLFDQTFGRWIFRQCDSIVTPAAIQRSFIKKFTHKEPVVIYSPIDYLPKKKIKNAIPHIGFLASLLPRKGCDLLIKALAEIQNQQWFCTIVGEGSEKTKLEELTHDLQIVDRIRFVGADDRDQRLHRFDIFVLPSYQEGLPTTVVEALLAKCIVVATDVGGTNEISNHADLILIQPGSVNEVVDGLQVAFSSLDKSGLSYESVKQQFGVQESIAKYLDICEKLAGDNT